MPPGSSVSNAVLAERFDHLEKLIETLTGAIENMEKRLSEVEKIEVRGEVDREKIRDIKADLDEVEKRVKKLEDALVDLIQTNKILRWIAGVFTAVLIAVVIGILTGNIEVFIK